MASRNHANFAAYPLRFSRSIKGSWHRNFTETSAQLQVSIVKSVLLALESCAKVAQHHN